MFIADLLADYAEEHGKETASPWRIAAALKSYWPKLVTA
jgi:hypothetical protein